MASKNQQFTSGLKQPSSFTKRKGPEISAATGVSKRPRDGSDGPPPLVRSKSSNNLPAPAVRKQPIARAPSTTSKPAVASIGSNYRPQACNNVRKPLFTTSRQVRAEEVCSPSLVKRVDTIEKKIKEQDENADEMMKKLDESIKECMQEIEDTKKEIKASEMDCATQNMKMEHKIRDMEMMNHALERENRVIESDLEAKRTENAGMKTSIAEISASEAGVRAQLDHAKNALRTTDEENTKSIGTIENLTKKIEEYESRLRLEESLRRQIHNTLLELKGNIRVFCRVRSVIPSDKMSGQLTHLNFVGENTIQVAKPGVVDMSLNESVMGTGRGPSKMEFSFDHVFGPNSSQQDIFSEIRQMVQSAIDGYNVCIFAYGQTGSGKTYTMEGGSSGSDSEGMIPRSVRLIFSRCEELKTKGWEYKIEASFLEIYNEQIRDLLGNGKATHDIKMVNNEITVTNLKVEQVVDEWQVSNLLVRAQRNRAVAATSCNDHSSRSHSILQLKISGANGSTNESTAGFLYMVDLAGSERLKESGATGDRLTETKHINKSLSNLGNVIMALSAKESHIPYRNSKLTHLLQQSLGGSAKTLMFVNVSPKESCTNETINSLRFAVKVNQCHIGTAVKNVE